MRATPELPVSSNNAKTTSEDRKGSRSDHRVWARSPPLPIASEEQRNPPQLDHQVNQSEYQNSEVFSPRLDRGRDSHHKHSQNIQQQHNVNCSKRHNSSSGRIGSASSEEINNPDMGPPAPPRITSLHSPNAHFNIPPLASVAMRRSMSPQLENSCLGNLDSALLHSAYNQYNPNYQVASSREDGSLEDVFVTDSPTGHYENPADFSPSMGRSTDAANRDRNSSKQESQNQHPMSHFVKQRIEVPSDQLTPTPVHKSSLLGNAKQRSSFAGDVSGSKPHKFESSIEAIKGSSSNSSFVVASHDATKSSSGAQIRRLDSQQPPLGFNNGAVQMRNPPPKPGLNQSQSKPDVSSRKSYAGVNQSGSRDRDSLDEGHAPYAVTPLGRQGSSIEVMFLEHFAMDIENRSLI